MMRALIVGCGYLGRRVAALWLERGHEVFALTRSPANASELKTLGVIPVIGDVLQPATLSRLPSVDIVFYAVGFDRQAGFSKRQVYVNGIKNVLKEIGSRVQKFLYVSSTSVYGQNAGEWVDENSPCLPAGEEGEICLAAEHLVWRTFGVPGSKNAGSAAIILRFSGIYGPRRLLRRVESIRRAEPIYANPEGFLNLVHVDDGAEIATAVAARAASSAIYLVTDDEPVRRRDYYSQLAVQLGAPPPVFQCNATEQARLNKRCSNAKVHAELGEVLRFPTIKTGLMDALRELDL